MALTPCPSPLAKSAPGEGSVLSFSCLFPKKAPLSLAFLELRGRNLGSSPLPERFLRGERGRG